MVKEEEEEEEDFQGLEQLTEFRPSATSDEFTDYVGRGGYIADEDKKPKIPASSKGLFRPTATMQVAFDSDAKKKRDAVNSAIKDVARALVLEAHAGGQGVTDSDVKNILKTRGVDPRFTQLVNPSPPPYFRLLLTLKSALLSLPTPILSTPAKKEHTFPRRYPPKAGLGI